MTEPNISSDSSEGDPSPPAAQVELPGHPQQPDIPDLQQEEHAQPRGAIGRQPIIEDIGPEEAPEPAPPDEGPVPGSLVREASEPRRKENITVINKHYHYNQQRTLHYNTGPVYKGEFKGEISGTKMDVKDSKIRSIGAPPQANRPSSRRLLSALGAPPSRPALGWHGQEERSTRSARGSSRQPLGLLPVPSDEEEQSNENEGLGEVEGQEESIQPPILPSSPNAEEQPLSYEAESFGSSLGTAEGGEPSSTELDPQLREQLSIFSKRKENRHCREKALPPPNRPSSRRLLSSIGAPPSRPDMGWHGREERPNRSKARGSSHQPLMLPPVLSDEDDQSNETEDSGAVGGYRSDRPPPMSSTSLARNRDRSEIGRRRGYLPIYDHHAREREPGLIGQRSRRYPPQPQEPPPSYYESFRDEPHSAFPTRSVQSLAKKFETREPGHTERQQRSFREPRRLDDGMYSYFRGSRVQSSRVGREDRYEAEQEIPTVITQLREHRDTDESSSSFVEDPSLTIPKDLYGEREFGESRHAVSRARRQERTMMLSNIGW
uniref:uncharacterized protein LOC120335054 n=1 Tax=Styela clava TaxID=7725 RepID=UPI0019394708|nr:uncharacterized protein LOC120335054 [Styela clava]